MNMIKLIGSAFAGACLYVAGNAWAAPVQIDVSGISSVVENTSGGPDQLGNSVFNFTGLFDSGAPVIFERPGARVFSPFTSHSSSIGAYEIAGVTGTVAYLDGGALFGGQTVDLVNILFTNIAADPDAPATDNIISTSGPINGLPLGQVLVSFFVDPSAPYSAATFELSDLPGISLVASLTVMTAIFDADVDAAGQAPAGGPRLVLATINPSTSFSSPSEVPLPAGVWLFATGVAGLMGVRKRLAKAIGDSR